MHRFKQDTSSSKRNHTNECAKSYSNYDMQTTKKSLSLKNYRKDNELCIDYWKLKSKYKTPIIKWNI